MLKKKTINIKINFNTEFYDELNNPAIKTEYIKEVEEDIAEHTKEWFYGVKPEVIVAFKNKDAVIGRYRKALMKALGDLNGVRYSKRNKSQLSSMMKEAYKDARELEKL